MMVLLDTLYFQWTFLWASAAVLSVFYPRFMWTAARAAWEIAADAGKRAWKKARRTWRFHGWVIA